MGTSEWLYKHDREFYDTVERVVRIADSSHVEPPTLEEGDLKPEDLPAEALFISDGFDDMPPRQLKNVWEGRGDHDDPFVVDYWSEDPAALEHDDKVLAKRMREDSDSHLG